jgi:hypothetical protein
MSESIELPEVEPRDPEPVAVAIETARALFRTGERLDALRWLRRAAERAEEAGDDVRSVSLARSAADLSTELQSVPPPPVASAPPPTIVSAPPLAGASAPPPTSRRNDEAAALAPYDDFSDKTAVDVMAPPVVREALQSGVHITELPDSQQQSPRSVTMPSPSSSIPVGSSPIAPDVIARPAPRQALRVAVSADPRTPGTWLVHPLNEGVSAPVGSEEALLVALDPNSTLFD